MQVEATKEGKAADVLWTLGFSRVAVLDEGFDHRERMKYATREGNEP